MTSYVSVLFHVTFWNKWPIFTEFGMMQDLKVHDDSILIDPTIIDFLDIVHRPVNFWTPEPTFMKLGMPEPISKA
jgi:hypothetical protein